MGHDIKRIERIARIARVGMVLGFVEHQEALKPKGTYKRLLKDLKGACYEWVERFKWVFELSDAEKSIIEARIHEFGALTGWESKPKHVVTYLSFCLCAMEDLQGGRKIIKALNRICARFESFGANPWACMPAGSLAMDKWTDIWNAYHKRTEDWVNSGGRKP